MSHWVRCPRDGHVWETRSTHIKITCPSCGYKIPREANLLAPEELMEHFNVDERGVKILDRSLKTERSPRGIIVDVYFKETRAWCEYDQTEDCKHVEYALSLPIVKEIFKKKGWR